MIEDYRDNSINNFEELPRLSKSDWRYESFLQETEIYFVPDKEQPKKTVKQRDILVIVLGLALIAGVLHYFEKDKLVTNKQLN